LFAGTALAASVNSNYLPETDFSAYRTYHWVPMEVEGAQHLDSISAEQITRAVDKQLQAKGWTRTDSSEADTYVAFEVAIENQTRVSSYGGWGWHGGGHVSSTNVDVGTLTLDIYDPKQKVLLWRGTATDTLKTKASPEKRQSRLDKAVAKML